MSNSAKKILEKLRQHCNEKRFRVEWQEKVTEHQRAQTFPGKNWTLSVPKTLRFENAETLRFLFRGPKNR